LLGNYDAGFGSLTTHPYEYRNYQQQPTSYANDFLQSTHAHAAYSNNHYAEPMTTTTNKQDLPFTDYTNQHAYPDNTTNQQEVCRFCISYRCLIYECS